MFKVRRTFHAQIVHVFGLSLISHLPPNLPPSSLSVPFLPFSPFRGLGGFSSLACSFFARYLGAGFPALRCSVSGGILISLRSNDSFRRFVLCPLRPNFIWTRLCRPLCAFLAHHCASLCYSFALCANLRCSFRWHFCRRIPQRSLCRIPPGSLFSISYHFRLPKRLISLRSND